MKVERSNCFLNSLILLKSLIRMSHRHSVLVLSATIYFITFVQLVATGSLDLPYQDSLLYTWSSNPVCSSVTLKSDCQRAAVQICGVVRLDSSANVTIGGCTAFYWYDEANTVPTVRQCNDSYNHILANSTGGALGYGTKGRRTNHPIYAIFPEKGNGNCFKAPGDTSPPLATNKFANGQTLSTCPASTSRRRAKPTTEESQTECTLEKRVWGYSCSAICLSSVVSTSWM